MSRARLTAVALIAACFVALAAVNRCIGATTRPAATSPSTAAATNPTSDDYKLVWADEFNVDGPLGAKDWSFEQGFVRNQELQWYQPDNAVCTGGNLVIEARREEKPNPRYRAGSTQWQTSRQNIEYTSASVNTRGKHSWLYGRFETRAKIDTRAGSWPAFWMLGNTGGWPANGEIDIMEYYKNGLLANFAWAGPNGTQKWNSSRKPLTAFATDWASQFHVWRMDWDEKTIKLYCDDALLNSQDVSKSINPNGVNPFRAPMYILFDLAIGGQSGGDPTNTTFPVRFEIDYVRVYQRPSQIAAATTRPAS